MTKVKLEYIWLDGYTPVAGLRSKTKIIDGDPAKMKLEDVPRWSFDGSSTRQAEGKSSDIILNPVALFPDITRKNAFLVMSETLLHTGEPHPTNTRATIPDDPETWFGFEQEYFFWQNGAPLGFPSNGFPSPQGTYYTGVGYTQIGPIARRLVEEHIDICLGAGINIEGVNAEVAKGQWEFQIFGKGSKTAADEMWVARYILMRLCEPHGVDIEWHCKPVRGAYNQPLDWNGSGMHTNFSTKYMREQGGKAYFEKLMTAFARHHDEHIAAYGPDNHLRLTGLHETQSIDKFTFGQSDRGASVRMPVNFTKHGFKGYLEDRRPNSAADPYLVAGRILKTIQTVPIN